MSNFNNSSLRIQSTALSPWIYKSKKHKKMGGRHRQGSKQPPMRHSRKMRSVSFGMRTLVSYERQHRYHLVDIIIFSQISIQKV